jgi:hypothetical protein
MTGVTVPIAPIPLARSTRRLFLAPAILFVSGTVAATAGALRGDLAGIGLVAAGLLVVAMGVALWLIVWSVQLFVEVATLRVQWIGGERRYTLVRGPVTRVPLRGRDSARLRPRFGALGWGLGRATLRGEEQIEIVRMAASDTMILVPTDHGRVGIAPASEQQLLNALAAAARIQQRLDEVVERARAYAPPPPPPEPHDVPVAQSEERERLLTGIQRAILEERLAEQRAAALAAAEAERQAAADAAHMAELIDASAAGATETTAARQRRRLAAPAMRLPSVRLPAVRMPSATVPRPRLAIRRERVVDFAVAVLPVVVAVAVWTVALVQHRLDLPVMQLRPAAVALLATGPVAALAAVGARVWFPRLVGLVAVTSLVALVLVGRALLG